MRGISAGRKKVIAGAAAAVAGRDWKEAKKDCFAAAAAATVPEGENGVRSWRGRVGLDKGRKGRERGRKRGCGQKQRRGRGS